MKIVTERFFCDVCDKETDHHETITVGIKPREGLSCSSNSGDTLIKEFEICEECYDKRNATIELKWQTTADDLQVGRCILVKSSIEI